jgi:hypothetical protein
VLLLPREALVAKAGGTWRLVLLNMPSAAAWHDHNGGADVMAGPIGLQRVDAMAT